MTGVVITTDTPCISHPRPIRLCMPARDFPVVPELQVRKAVQRGSGSTRLCLRLGTGRVNGWEALISQSGSPQVLMAFLWHLRRKTIATSYVSATSILPHVLKTLPYPAFQKPYYYYYYCLHFSSGKQ